MFEINVVVRCGSAGSSLLGLTEKVFRQQQLERNTLIWKIKHKPTSAAEENRTTRPHSA